jgi:DNA-binding response OmpR family regulator
MDTKAPTSSAQDEQSEARGAMSSLSLLVADDSQRFTNALARRLRRHAPNWTVDSVHEPSPALERMLSRQHDIVTIDWSFPTGMSGLELCRRARAAGSDAAIVMLTAQAGIDHRVKAFEAGVADFIVKGTIPARELCQRLACA